MRTTPTFSQRDAGIILLGNSNLNDGRYRDGSPFRKPGVRAQQENLTMTAKDIVFSSLAFAAGVLACREYKRRTVSEVFHSVLDPGSFTAVPPPEFAYSSDPASQAEPEPEPASHGLAPPNPELAPTEHMNLYLDGFHFESGNLAKQSEAHHFCSILHDDVAQCAIFDGTGPGARLIGIEYIISERLFHQLPEEERPLWHSHAYEIKSGQLRVPGLLREEETDLMRTLQTTYGKTWQTWDPTLDRRAPLGIPKLMMAFTDEGQIEPALLAERDRLLKLSTRDARTDRAGFPDIETLPGADAWRNGGVAQLSLAKTGMNYSDGK